MGLTPYENLKGFVSTRPPLVVFMICLGSFAVILLTLAYYVKVQELRNPDVSQVSLQFLILSCRLHLALIVWPNQTFATIATNGTIEIFS